MAQCAFIASRKETLLPFYKENPITDYITLNYVTFIAKTIQCSHITNTDYLPKLKKTLNSLHS